MICVIFARLFDPNHKRVESVGDTENAIDGRDDMYETLGEIMAAPFGLWSCKNEVREPLTRGGRMELDVAMNDAGDGYVVEAVLPRVDKDEVDIEVDGGMLTVKVDHVEKKDVSSDGYIRKETRSWSERRSIPLDGAVADGASAKMENGVLRIEIPKVDKKSGCGIEIA